MKRLLLFCTLFCINSILAQNIEGAWRLIEESGKKVKDKEVFKIVKDDYFSVIAKNTANNTFLYTYGGEIEAGDYSFSTILDFNSENPGRVGRKTEHRFILNGIMLNVFSRNGKREVWRKISSEENALAGNWFITGRANPEGEIKTIAPGDRRTIKIFGGDRFQWVAFNSATKEFHATGGGTYSAEDGVYIENIDVFSKDKNRVGAELEFQFEVKDGKWHHKGKSSKGDPIYEVWSPYREGYNQR